MVRQEREVHDLIGADTPDVDDRLAHISILFCETQCSDRTEYYKIFLSHVPFLIRIRSLAIGSCSFRQWPFRHVDLARLQEIC